MAFMVPLATKCGTVCNGVRRPLLSVEASDYESLSDTLNDRLGVILARESSAIEKLACGWSVPIPDTFECYLH